MYPCRPIVAASAALSGCSRLSRSCTCSICVARSSLFPATVRRIGCEFRWSLNTMAQAYSRSRRGLFKTAQCSTRHMLQHVVRLRRLQPRRTAAPISVPAGHQNSCPADHAAQIEFRDLTPVGQHRGTRQKHSCASSVGWRPGRIAHVPNGLIDDASSEGAVGGRSLHGAPPSRWERTTVEQPPARPRYGLDACLNCGVTRRRLNGPPWSHGATVLLQEL